MLIKIFIVSKKKIMITKIVLPNSASLLIGSILLREFRDLTNFWEKPSNYTDKLYSLIFLYILNNHILSH